MTELDHIGYAVANIETYVSTFSSVLFQPAEVGEIVGDPIQRVRVAFVTLAGGSRIELIEPLEKNSPVSRIIERGRGGLYHVCYRADDLELLIPRLREKEWLVVSGPSPAAALNGRRVIFVLTPQADLIEFVEDYCSSGT